MQNTTKTTTRKLLVMFLCLVLTISAIPPLHFPAQAISEYPHDDYVFSFYEDWDMFDANGLAVLEAQMIEPLNLSGYTTRGEAAALLVLAREPGLLTSPNTPNIVGRFSDVRPQDWFYPAVAWAASRGWVQGDDLGRFRPNDRITREEFVAIVVRAVDPRPSNWPLTAFRDANQITPWAIPYMRRAVENRWIIGTPEGLLNPRHFFLRVDALTFARRFPTPGVTVNFPTNIRTITWNASGGSSVTAWQRLAGSVIGNPMPNPTWSGRTFRGWNTTDGRTARGVAVTASTFISSGTGAVTYFARWHEPYPSDAPHNGRRHMRQWYRSSAVTLRRVYFEGAWRDSLDDAMRNWGNSATPITVSFTATSNNIAQIGNRYINDPAVLGHFERQAYSGTTLNRFIIRIYTMSILNHAEARPERQVRNVAASVWAHEIGHAVGLADNPSGATGNNSLMRSGRDRNAIRGPQPFDQQSVNWLYR
ncbi:MAG: S-layer homology domain-containing protein [Oscillospiraceae bacterium]|nr:S-layer homology domain-containing protein [Oscillospiraceae bacterium]